MGILEEKSKKRNRYSATRHAIITTVALAGVLSVSVVAPNALSLLRTTVTGRRLTNRLFHAKSVFWQLVEEGYIEIDRRAKKNARLTAKGQKKFELSKTHHKPKKWDQKWRILTFDIKEKRRETRDKVRRSLQSFGFYRLQNSVWVYPYDCEEFVSLLKVDQKIGKDVLYVIADQIENDRFLRQYFDLPIT